MQTQASINLHNDLDGKVKVKLTRYRHCRRQGGEDYSSYSFLTSALDEGERSASRHDRSLSSGKDPRYPMDKRLGLRAGLDTEVRRKNPSSLPGTEPRSHSL
jgi:hypothetical protein